MSNSIKITAGYTGTDYTRDYTISGVADSICASPDAVANKIKAINASLAGGTSAGLDTTFRSEDYDATDAQNIIGKFDKITAAKIVEKQETILNINSQEEGD